MTSRKALPLGAPIQKQWERLFTTSVWGERSEKEKGGVWEWVGRSGEGLGRAGEGIRSVFLKLPFPSYVFLREREKGWEGERSWISLCMVELLSQAILGEQSERLDTILKFE